MSCRAGKPESMQEQNHNRAVAWFAGSEEMHLDNVIEDWNSENFGMSSEEVNMKGEGHDLNEVWRGIVPVPPLFGSLWADRACAVAW